MRSKTYSKRVTGVRAEDVWRVWPDVNRWHTWQPDIEYAKLDGDFKFGNPPAARRRQPPGGRGAVALTAFPCCNRPLATPRISAESRLTCARDPALNAVPKSDSPSAGPAGGMTNSILWSHKIALLISGQKRIICIMLSLVNIRLTSN